MSDLSIVILVGGLGAATYLIRFSFLGLLAGRRLPDVVMEALSFVPVTVLPALVAPMVLFEDGVLTAEPARIAGACVGLALGALLRNVLAAIIGAMATFAVFTAVAL